MGLESSTQIRSTSSSTVLQSASFHIMSSSYEKSTGIKVLLALTAIGGFLGLMYILASQGPQRVDLTSSEQSGDLVGGGSQHLLLEARELESKYEELRVSGQLTEDSIQLLVRARDLLDAYTLSLTNRNWAIEADRDVLTGRIDDIIGTRLAEEADALEREATLIEGRSPDEALPIYRQALALREEIRNRHASSSANSLTKIAQLSRKIAFLELRPLRARSEELETLGQESLNAKDWNTARTYFAEAAEIQEFINASNPGGRLGDPRRATALRDKESSVASGPLFEEVESLTQQAQSVLAENLHNEAARLFERAQSAQARLNREFPRSYFASREREAKLGQKSADARSISAFNTIVELDQKLNSHLRKSEIPASIQVLEEISDRIQIYNTAFFDATHPIRPIMQRINFLMARRSDLANLHDTLIRGLIPLKPGSHLRLYHTEVPQWLYELITGTNPSRELGLSNPVESVTYNDAMDFCDKLSIILARPVRLPSRAEYEIAVEPMDDTARPSRVWSSGTGTGIPREVGTSQPNSAGFYDLLGNVGEWTLAELSNRTFIYGGNVRDLLSAIVASPATPTLRTERNRFSGFRFIVDFRESAL